MKQWSCNEFLNLKIPMNLVKVDERNFVFEKKTIEGNHYKHRLYLVNLDIPDRSEFVDEGELPSVFCPKTLKDSAMVKIAYWKGDVLTVTDIKNGEKKSLGTYRNHSKASWSKDGTRVAFTASYIFEKEPLNVPDMENVLWIDRTNFKSDEKGIFDGSYEQVYVADVENGECHVLTGERTDYSNAVFIDNNMLAFSAVLEDVDFSDAASILIYHFDTRITETISGPGGPITEISADTENKKLYILSHDNRYWEATNFRIYMIDLKTGVRIKKCREMETNLPRSVGNYVLNDVGLKRTAPVLRWDEREKALYANITDGYCTDIYRINEGSVTRLTEHDRVIMEYLVMGDDLLILYSSVNVTAEILWIKKEGVTSIWNENDSYDHVDAMRFEYAGAEGELYEGYCMLPGEKDSSGSRKLKGLVLDIHGGPHFCHGLAFSIDVHTLVNAGYGVVYCNPTGSQGSGEKLARGSYHDWGGKDYRDLLNCQKSVQKIPGFEALRWAVKGGSYGGYMVNWVVTHTDRFTCALSERSTCNRYSQAGTSDCAFRYGKFEFDGFPWDNCESYMRRSPITYVKNVNTPVLLIHGDADMNCPVSQSEEFFSALKLEHKEAYFARFKGQNHGFAITGDPKSRQERYKLLVWWLDRYMADHK